MVHWNEMNLFRVKCSRYNDNYLKEKQHFLVYHWLFFFAATTMWHTTQWAEKWLPFTKWQLRAEKKLTIELDEDVRDDKRGDDWHGIHKKLERPASRMPRITNSLELACSKCCGKHHPEKYLPLDVRKWTKGTQTIHWCHCPCVSF